MGTRETHGVAGLAATEGPKGHWVDAEHCSQLAEGRCMLPLSGQKDGAVPQPQPARQTGDNGLRVRATILGDEGSEAAGAQ